ncbi:MAG: hypothetical protein ABIL68_16580 [bacterium]
MMKTARRLIQILVAGVSLQFFTGCTWNPFGSNDISGGYREVSGTVQLHDGSSPEGVYVWLESFNVGTTTDETGQFTIALPAKSSQGASSGLSGVYNLYFFVANYGLKSAQVVVQEGEFVYSRGDVNKDGRLAALIILKRFLRIEMDVDPAIVDENYTGNIRVTVTLTAAQDSVSAIIPESIGDGSLGAVLIRKMSTREVFIHKFSIFGGMRVKVLVGRQSYNTGMNFNLITKPLEAGMYEVIPFLLIAHEPIPEGMLDSISLSAQNLCPDYLKIPFMRQGGAFEVR